MNPLRLLTVTAALGLAACVATPPPPTAPAPPPPEEGTTRYRCGPDHRATLVVQDDTLRLRVGGDAVALVPVPAASGARYEAVGDPSTVFWSRGTSAQVTWRGVAWPACEAEAPGAMVQAAGKGWRLDLHGPRVSLRDADGRPLAEGRTTGPRRIGRTLTYNATTGRGMLVVTVLEQACTGPLPRPLTVQVAFEGRVLDGCGGETTALLQGPVWVVEDLHGQGLVDGSRVTMNFAADGHVAGHGSCNAYTGTYTLSATGIAFGRPAATLMACAPALMQQEERFLRALQAVRQLEVTADGALVLAGGDGARIRARRE